MIAMTTSSSMKVKALRGVGVRIRMGAGAGLEAAGWRGILHETDITLIGYFHYNRAIPAALRLRAV